ncbi:MAG: 50S ribosomal protein L29 [Flavobacteriaceae bacterium]
MKQLEISKLNIKDLEAKIIELKKKLFDLRMSSYVSELENPVQIRNIRRTIARLKTAKTKLNKDLIS